MGRRARRFRRRRVREMVTVVEGKGERRGAKWNCSVTMVSLVSDEVATPRFDSWLDSASALPAGGTGLFGRSPGRGDR